MAKMAKTLARKGLHEGNGFGGYTVGLIPAKLINQLARAPQVITSHMGFSAGAVEIVRKDYSVAGVLAFFPAASITDIWGYDVPPEARTRMDPAAPKFTGK